jgi:hypothetical protein
MGRGRGAPAGDETVSGRQWQEVIRENFPDAARRILARHWPILISVAQASAFATRAAFCTGPQAHAGDVGAYGETWSWTGGLATAFSSGFRDGPHPFDRGRIRFCSCR